MAILLTRLIAVHKGVNKDNVAGRSTKVMDLVGWMAKVPDLDYSWKRK